jgi:hypothetical protein
VPSSFLPLGGRDGPIPAIPDSYELGSAGRVWWEWAWALPQAAKWDIGSLHVVARRASLEDDLAGLGQVATLDLAALLDPSIGEREAGGQIRRVVRGSKRTTVRRTGVLREMRLLDNRLGLNPKAMADLRWRLVGEAPRPVDRQARRHAPTGTSGRVLDRPQGRRTQTINEEEQDDD